MILPANNSRTTIKILIVLSYILMIAINILANLIPINGVTTGEVSDAYPNLITPAAYTFSIWGLIYLLLGLHTLYQLGFFRKENRSSVENDLLNYVGLYFSISSIANSAWIISWHYFKIPLSVVIMIIILACLILINVYTKRCKLNSRDKIFVRLPFSIYFGWITVATITNITVMLVSLNWNGFGLSDVTWAIIVLILGIIIGILTIISNKDIAYGLVYIWAYNGILVKHISPNGFAFEYKSIVYTIIICILMLIAAEIFVLFKKGKR